MRVIGDYAHSGAVPMASGAGHDAAVFAGAGIPSAMLFVRNANGSHNPDETMDMEDFRDAVRLLSHGVWAGTADRQARGRTC